MATEYPNDTEYSFVKTSSTKPHRTVKNFFRKLIKLKTLPGLSRYRTYENMNK